MTRPLFRISALLLLTAGLLRAQTPSPVVSAQIATQSGGSSQGAVAVDLTQHFTISGLVGQLVRFETSLSVEGASSSWDVMLRPDHAPNHVTNFLSYVDSGFYNDTIIHRSANMSDEDPDFWDIIQGGGYTADAPDPAFKERSDPVGLEYSLPNARGSLAAARATDPDSATSEWYFNVADNSDELGEDNFTGGYTVFGTVIGNGMDTVELIATINIFNYSGFAGIPLRFYTQGTAATRENYVVVERIFRIDTYPISNDDEAALSFTASSSDESIATVSINGSTLSVNPVAPGTATITVAANGVAGAQAEQTFDFISGGIEVAAQPTSQNVAVGGSATLSVDASADASNIAYQWYFHRAGMSEPAAISGANAASYTINNVQNANMGSYFVRMTTTAQELDSDVVLLTTTEGTSRLANLATRGRITAGGSLTPGFVLAGDGPKPLLVRAVGPGLAQFLGDSALADPTLDLIPSGGSTAVASNDNWGDAANAASVETTAASVGAFGLEAGSADAVLLTDVALPNSQGNRGYTARIQATEATATGIAIAEVYDPEAIGSGARLINVSALGYSGAGVDALVPGLVIEGSGAKTVLLRVAGPELARFAVVNTMANPRLSVVPQGQSFSVASNDNWGGTTALKTAFASVGAFAFEDDASLDAAVVVRLPPGAYTVVVEGADGGDGVVLVEAYDLD